MAYRYGQGSFDPSDLEQMNQWNPFYNPMSPNPDVGKGIAGILQMLVANKEQKKKESLEQQRWNQEFGLKQQEAEALNRYHTAMAKKVSLPASIQEAQALVESGDAPDLGAAVQMLHAKKATEPLPYEIPAGDVAKVEQEMGWPAGTWDVLHPTIRKIIHQRWLDKTHPKPTAAGVVSPEQKEKTRLVDLAKKSRAELEKEYNTLSSDINKHSEKITASMLAATKASQAGDMASFKIHMAEKDRLLAEKKSLEDQRDSMGRSYLSGETGEPPTPEIPPEVLAAAKRARPDLSTEEIIKQWQATHKK